MRGTNHPNRPENPNHAIPFAAQDFRRIAQHLDARSTGDCVQHYYRVQKADEFAAVRRKQQLKKRRQQSEVNRSITYLGMAGLAGGVKRGAELGVPGGCPCGPAPYRGPCMRRGASSACADPEAPRDSRGPGLLCRPAAAGRVC